MINQLLICDKDLDSLVGKLVLSRDHDEHNLVNINNKKFVMEKRLKMVVSTDGRYGLARLHPHYDIKFRSADDFVDMINERTEEDRFFSLVTPTELKLIQRWQMEDLLAL